MRLTACATIANSLNSPLFVRRPSAIDPVSIVPEVFGPYKSGFAHVCVHCPEHAKPPFTATALLHPQSISPLSDRPLGPGRKLHRVAVLGKLVGLVPADGAPDFHSCRPPELTQAGTQAGTDTPPLGPFCPCWCWSLSAGPLVMVPWRYWSLGAGLLPWYSPQNQRELHHGVLPPDPSRRFLSSRLFRQVKSPPGTLAPARWN